jgi:hypothetical protein
VSIKPPSFWQEPGRGGSEGRALELGEKRKSKGCDAILGAEALLPSCVVSLKPSGSPGIGISTCFVHIEQVHICCSLSQWFKKQNAMQ